MGRFLTLTDNDLTSIKECQNAEQNSWRNAPDEGQVVVCCGKKFDVLPGVFPPRGDSQLLVDHLTIEPGSFALDMGTGSGVLAVFAALKGAEKVVAVDINPMSVGNAAQNAKRHGLSDRIETRLSDGFAAIGGDEWFDVIIANLPGRNELAPDVIAAAQWDTGFKTHKAFFASAPGHLKPGGAILMVKANYPELNDVVELAENVGFNVSVLAKKPMPEGDPRIYYVLAFSRSPTERDSCVSEV